MIEPLLQICAKRMADYIYEGELRNLDWRLDEKLSNIVFEQFYEMEQEITEEAADEISKKLKVTKMHLDRNDFDEIHQKMVFSQNLEQLQLTEPCSSEIFYQFNLVTDGDFVTPDNVIGVLKRLLNRKSLKKLQTLRIGTLLYFRSGWIKKMSEVLPNIGNLELPVHNMEQQDFIDLCNCFKKITKLRFSSNNIIVLDGISKLENLETLNISGVYIDDDECFMDLFKLKKLKVLNISGSFAGGKDLVDNIGFYLKCDKFLPELKYIDCSFNHMNLEMLEKLVETHPKLETIGLIGTSINKTPQLQNKNVKLLTEENLKCCMESLDHFSKINDVESVHILKSIRAIISENYEQQTESDLHKLFNQLIPIVQQDMFIHLESIECLEELSRGDRMMMFDINERQSLIKMLLFLSKKWFLNCNIEDEFHESLWRILNNEILLLNTKPENANEICDRAVYMTVEGKVYGEEIFGNCLEVLTLSMWQKKPETLLKWGKNWKLTKRLLRVMNSFDEAEGNFSTLLNLIYKLHSIYPTKSIPRSREYIKTLMRNLKDYMEDTNIQREIVNTLELLVVHINPVVYSLFFTEANYEMILTLLSNETTKESTLFLLVTLFYCTEEGKTENLELSVEERVEDILKVIRKYKVVNDSDKFGMFLSIISTSKSEETILCAKWILSNFKECQEPRPKRRRMQ